MILIKGSFQFLNLFVQYQFEDLQFGIGIYDITDQVQDFIQPYDSWTAPMPGVGREIALKLNYRFPF
jgi:hypothetical protein